MPAQDAEPAALPREKRKREGEVLQAAIDVFWEKGYAAASVADVAERVGMLKGSLYYYVDSKEDLLARIFKEINHQAVAIVAETAALDLPPLERVRAYFERYVRWYLDNVEQVSLYFSEWRHLTGERRTLVLEQRATFERFVRGLIEAAKDAGEIDPGVDAAAATNFLLGAVNSVSTWYRRDGALSAEQVALRYGALVRGTLVGTRAADPQDAREGLASQALGIAARRLRGRLPGRQPPRP